VNASFFAATAVARVARLVYIFNQKYQFLSIFEGLGVETFGEFNVLLVNFIAIWYIVEFLRFLSFLVILWYIFPVLVCWTKINLATLAGAKKLKKIGAMNGSS
jgi:hypothetical protein